ncbi:MAG: efflux RND transporter permease subunit [Planctomycetaceae bacterium]
MFNGLISWSLRNRFLVLAGWLALAGLGGYAMSVLPIDAFPDTTPVQVQINTVAGSLVPEEIETQITFPIELALSGLPGLDQVRSISQFGLSQIVVTFEDGVNIYFARQLINERLTTVELPESVSVRPEMGPVSTGLGEVFHYYLTGNLRNLGEQERVDFLTTVRTVQDWQLRPILRPTPGTAEINPWGGYKKQYQIRVDPQKLIKYDLAFDTVVHAIRQNNMNVGGGNITENGGMLLVHGIGRTGNVEQLENIVIRAQEGVPIRVRDVADVGIGHEIRRGAVTATRLAPSSGQGADLAAPQRIEQGEVVLGLGFMLMGENSYKVTRRLKDRLDEARPRLPAGVQAVLVYDRTELVDKVINTVSNNLFEGGLLVIAILFVFLGNLRAGLIVALAIPLSLLFAFCGMLRWGIAASLLSLGALDFGLVVDSSVVMIENAVRRLSHADPRLPRATIIGEACSEVSKPSVFGVFIIMIVYIPILTLEGVEGKMFRPMALTVVFALAGSLIMSLTLMPVLSSLVLRRDPHEQVPLPVRLANALYRPLLAFVMARPVLVFGVAFAALGAAFVAARGLGTEFVPRLNEGALVIGITRMPGTSLEESIRLNLQMERMIVEAFPDEVENAWSRTGAPEVATDASTVEQIDFFITLKPVSQWKRAHSQAELVELMNERIKNIPGQMIYFTQPIEQRINEMISGVRTDVAVKLFGDDLKVLLEKAGEIRNVLAGIDGVADLAVEQMMGQPVLQVRVRQAEIARYGVSAESVLDLVQAVSGKPVGEVLEDQLRFPLALRLPEDYRGSTEAIRGILIPTARGERIPLERLADIRTVEGARVITREWGKRRISIQCNIRGRDMGGFVNEAQRKIEEQVQLPPGGYYITWGGQFENLQRASRRLTLVVPLSLALILIMLYFMFNNLFDSCLVFSSVPFACVGGVLALAARGMPFSISAAVGFIALSGISVLNSLVLVEFIRHLATEGLPVEEAIREAAHTRLRPVLMTALVASLGFVPMALSHGMGAEVQRPLATVVIGGVITCTIMTLLVLPLLYQIASRVFRPEVPGGHVAGAIDDDHEDEVPAQAPLQIA